LPYFHTLSIFYTQSFCYFPLRSWFFEILDFFMVVVARVQKFGRRRKTGPHQFHQFFENLEKIGEI
jgi:hypothetical protein